MEQRLSDGDLLLVSPTHDVRVGSVAITGHVRHPGPRALAEVETLTGLLAGADLLPEPYLQFAVLETTDPATLARVMVPIDLQAVLDRRTDPMLSPDDILIVLGSADVSFLTSTPVLKLLRTGGKAGPARNRLCRRLRPGAGHRGRSQGHPGGKSAGARGSGSASGSDALPAHLQRSSGSAGVRVEACGAAAQRGDAPRPVSCGGQSDVAALARKAGGGSEKLAVVDGTGLNRQKSDQPAGAARRGDIVDATTPKFELTGHVRYPGTRALAGAGTLRQALGDGSQNLPGLYPLFGVIERQDRSRMTSRLIAFSPHEVISGVSDRPLSDGDHVRLFAASEIRSFMRIEREPGAGQGEHPTPDPRTMLTRPTRPIRRAALRSLMVEHAVMVHGAVRQPGSYPVDGQVRLEMLLATAGGLTAQADSDAIEITSPETVRSGNRDKRQADGVAPCGQRNDHRNRAG